MSYRWLALAAFVGCTSTSSAPSSPAGGDDGGAPPLDAGAPPPAVDAGVDAAVDGGLLGQRPYNFKVPAGYDSSKPTPLVILFHGYGADGHIQDAYFKLGALADQRTFLYAYPDGTLDPGNNRFWNADDACCDFYGIRVDDVAYARAIIDDVEQKYNVDPKRVFIVGHSNGGFMSHRLACDLSDRVAAIVSLAGAVWFDATKCTVSSPVAVLEVHGDADQTVSYAGGQFFSGGPTYPSAHQTIATWATRDACPGSLQPTGQTLDIDSSLAGAETRVERYACTTGAAELWTIQGGSHIPNLQPTWAGMIYDWMSAHPKP